MRHAGLAPVTVLREVYPIGPQEEPQDLPVGPGRYQAYVSVNPASCPRTHPKLWSAIRLWALQNRTLVPHGPVLLVRNLRTIANAAAPMFLGHVNIPGLTRLRHNSA